ncbi:MAG: hypothetical protein KJ906_02670 [Nanoarchaeota archaeon]|nr:hypothetical protein [Nanoarchaeota archaeon]
MNQKTLNQLIILSITFILLTTTVHAFTISDENYKIVGLISDGGNKISINNYVSYASIGQPLINPETDVKTTWFGLGKDYVVGGNLTDDPPNKIFGIETNYPESLADGDQGKYNLCLGAFCTEAFAVPYTINITGKITYDLGGEVANSEAKLKIKYGLTTFEGESVQTDENGIFTANLSIPERIATQPFIISVYANGRVEAEYNCKYNRATKHCDKI